MTTSNIELSEEEVKTALRIYIQKYVKTTVDIWGLMELKVNGERLSKASLIFTDTDRDEEESEVE